MDSTFEMETRHSVDRLTDGVRLTRMALEYLKAHPEEKQQQLHEVLTFLATLSRETSSLYTLIQAEKKADALEFAQERYGRFCPQQPVGSLAA